MLPFEVVSTQISTTNNALRNQTDRADYPFHVWYQFVLGYPPHFVRHCLSKFNATKTNLVLDPFCGTGTTNVECKRLGIRSIGVEANPMAHFAASVKTNWSISSDNLRTCSQIVARAAIDTFAKLGLSDNTQLSAQDSLPSQSTVHHLDSQPRLSESQTKLLLKHSISKLPLQKVLILKELIIQLPDQPIKNALLLALAKLIVNDASNLAFGPEIYTTKPKKDFPAINMFFQTVGPMIQDLANAPVDSPLADVKLGDSRNMANYLDRNFPVDYAITSPPYPNEKDYTRITRLESVILGFINDRKSLRDVKTNLLRSNSRNIFVSDVDDDFVKDFPQIQRIAKDIEKKRIALNKTSGFERLYHRIVTQYFGGMYQHLSSLKPYLAPQARLAYIVGDQMSFFRVNIRTAEILGNIAESLGYQVDGVDLWRTRLATRTKADLNENILMLRNKG